MTGRIPENILEEILSRANIVEIISGYIPLKRAGRNFKALCPFHHEKTPSFMVSPDRQIYHCFGCNSGGNVFNFLMRYERLEFPEVVETLAKKTGVVLPKTEEQDAKTVSLYTQLYKINELATLFYINNLNSLAGTKAKNYLFKRGIKEETIKSFKLGFAPDKWDSLINYLRVKNINLSLLEEAGLILAKEGGGYYDRFRNRIIFPIEDIKSRVLGLGGRLLPQMPPSQEAETLAKYVNSPQTPIYIKGRNLYGLNLAKESIKEFDAVVVVEGYLDFILPYQEGLKNMVASLGTALTIEQARLLKRYTHNVVMVYDADNAGEIATLRTLDIFIEEGMNVKVVSLPAGFDPDLFVRKNGIENFKNKIAQAENLFDYKLKILKSRYNLKEIEGKTKVSSEMLATINKFNNAVMKSEYIKRLSEELNIKEDALLAELRKIKEDRDYPDLNQAGTQVLKINPTEKLLIKLMLEEKELINRISASLEVADFQDELTAKIVSIMFELVAQGKNIEPHALINYFEHEEKVSRLISESMLSPEILSENKEKIVDDCIQRLKNQRTRQKKEDLQQRIKHAQDLGDEEKLQRLIKEFHCLIKQE